MPLFRFKAPQVSNSGQRYQDVVPLLNVEANNDGHDDLVTQGTMPPLHLDRQTRILTKALAVLGPIWAALRPQVLSPRRERKIRPTSWLDGLRGIAALNVVIAHNCLMFYRFRTGTCKAWTRNDPHVFGLPILRMHCSGQPMVDIFFIISGYALSYKPLSLIRARDFPGLARSLGSSTFRRGIRLYLPVVFITFINAMAIYLDLLHDTKIARKNSLGATLVDWAKDLLTGLDPFHIDKYHTTNMIGLEYEVPMWTIPYEYRGSMVVFIVLLGLGQVRPIPGLALLAAIVLYVLAVGQWDIFLFLSGILCCQVHYYLDTRRSRSTTSTSIDPAVLPTAGETLPLPQQNNRTTLRSMFGAVASVCGLLAILFVLSMPDYNYGTGYVQIYAAMQSLDPPSWKNLAPAGRFPICLASVILVLFVGQCRLFRDVLSSSFSQYLGEISFSIYLIHFFLLRAIGKPLMTKLSGYKDRVGLTEGYPAQIGNWLVLFAYSLVAMPLLFWLGELTTKYVDKKSVQLARWAEQKCFQTSDPQS